MRTSNPLVPTPELLSALGPFDFDPCAPDSRCYDAATESAACAHGLTWEGSVRVWLNPQAQTESAITPGAWVRRMAAHGRGTALLPATTSARCWADSIGQTATAVLFLASPLVLLRQDTDLAWSPVILPKPFALVAWGDGDASALEQLSRLDCGRGALMRVSPTRGAVLDVVLSA